MRLFVAIVMPSDQRRELADALSSLRTGRFPVRWTTSRDLHLTLKFLGEVPDPRTPDVERALVRGALDQASFELSVEGLGGFPNLRRPRVLWMGVEGGNPLRRLQNRIEEEFTTEGFEPEGRTFHPHITVGRTRSKADTRAFSDLPALATAVVYRARFRADEVHLIRSRLTPAGPEYSTMRSVALERLPEE